MLLDHPKHHMWRVHYSSTMMDPNDDDDHHVANPLDHHQVSDELTNEAMFPENLF